MKYKLRPSVAVVELDNMIEFFLSNIRRSIVLKVNTDLKNFLFKFDGKKNLDEICDEESITDEQKNDIKILIDFLNKHNIMLKIDEEYQESYKKYPRIYNLLEDYYFSQSQINNKFNKFQNSKVMIVGLGAVGTWVAHNLVMSGVKNFILVDFDKVDTSNLHRQIGFFKKDIGKLKIEALKNRLLEINKDINIELIAEKLDNTFFERNHFDNINLIVNCADYPSVDLTSEIVGEYCMQKNIPHLIGGGYNLHMTLIGQAIIPGKTACVRCFKKNLDEMNKIDTANIKKLARKERKIGSFTPLVSLSAAITSNEALKILLGIEKLVMGNNRCEFKLKDMNFQNLTLERRKDCEWCGEKGKYYKI